MPHQEIKPTLVANQSDALPTELHPHPCVPFTSFFLGGWGGGGVGGVAQLVEPRTGTLPTQVRFPSAARDFSPRVNFQCRLFYGVRKHPCATACTNICVHVKDLVVHARVRWIIETLKHPSCTVDWVARLCRSWLSPGKANQVSNGRNSMWTI